MTAGGGHGGPLPRLRALGAGAEGTRPHLLLLHGLGATADVWAPLTAELERSWPGGWTAVDLPGHGGSSPLPRVSFGALAAAVAQDVRRGGRSSRSATRSAASWRSPSPAGGSASTSPRWSASASR